MEYYAQHNNGVDTMGEPIWKSPPDSSERCVVEPHLEARMNRYDRLRTALAGWIAPSLPSRPVSLASVSSRVDDSPGWFSLTGRPHDYDQGRVLELYQDALTAWRKNPIAWRIIAITSDYVVGDHFEISSKVRTLNKFIRTFWHHPKNRVHLRLESMCDELSRSGDLFVLLFRNDQDGMSYLRFVTKDRIAKIETADNDWENELIYYETPSPDAGARPERSGGTGRGGGDPIPWYSPTHPDAASQPTIMLHYAINRPIGALMGESDLTTMIPWLQRYSHMLEDRVRLHWAVRAFLWLVTVPPNKIKEKREQYRLPPEAGSIVVKDENEKWEVATPTMHGADAAHDLKAVRGMVDAGSGYPPHWRGESGEANLATATAMQAPTERHLLRRQQYFTFILQDILFHAYQRAVQLGRVRPLLSQDYSELFTIAAPDISRADNEALARSTKDIMAGLSILAAELPGGSQAFNMQMLRMAFKFAGEPLTEETIAQIILESKAKADLDPEPQLGDLVPGSTKQAQGGNARTSANQHKDEG